MLERKRCSRVYIDLGDIWLQRAIHARHRVVGLSSDLLCYRLDYIFFTLTNSPGLPHLIDSGLSG